MARSCVVLVVDDDQDIRIALQECLDAEGHEVASSANGVEALELLQNGLRPDVIILDLMMPGMNGLEFLEALRRDARWSRVRVIVASANRGYSPEDLGVEAVLRKPFPLDDLCGAVMGGTSSDQTDPGHLS